MSKLNELIEWMEKTPPANLIDDFHKARIDEYNLILAKARELRDAEPPYDREAVAEKGFLKAKNSDYNFRRVISDLDNDLYYSGWMDCLDCVSSNGIASPPQPPYDREAFRRELIVEAFKKMKYELYTYDFIAERITQQADAIIAEYERRQNEQR